jgi:CheY-like chemotaxis protein/HPt (histidine-containing phosphotransfer) domain-containing protein
LAEYLQEIVINTVGNAIKYTDAGYVYVGIRFDRSSKSQSCTIEIADTGIGISAKLLPTIFEPFTLGDDSTARKYSGTGLGLTLTKQFVKNLNGNIEFKSIEGVGTQCSIAILSNFSGGDRIQPNSSEEIESCVLVSPREIGADERESFAAAKWNCHVSKGTDSDRTLFDSATAIFIDTDYRKHLDHVISSLSHLRSRRLIALYSPSESFESAERLEVNTIVRRGNVTHLVAAKNLTAAMFGTAKREVRHALKDESVEARSVLVADDNSTNLKTARLTLESYGLTVKTVDSGDKALSELENSQYHIAFIDLHMPSMSGVEVTQIYQYLFGEPRTPIVILTADATVSAREDAIRAGAVALLTKPLRATELRDAVDKYARAESRTPFEVSRPFNEMLLGDSELLDESVIQEFLDIGVSDVELNEVLVSFLEDGRTLIETYAQAAQRNDAAQIRDVMHSLKGACATVGARKLMRRIEEIGERPLVKERHDYQALSLELFDLLDESSRALMAKIE